MKKLSLNLGKLFDNRKFLMVFSLLVAVLCWILVAMTTIQTIDITIAEVPVDLSLVQDSLYDLNLSILEGTDQTVSVTVRGARTVVGQLGPDDMRVTARLSGISEAGLWDLQLTAAETTGDFEVVRFTPSSVRVRLDTLETRSFDITPVVNGLSVPPDYASEPERVTPSSVNITGPVTELDKISLVTVTAELEEPLTRNYAAADLPIMLYDVEGGEIDSQERYLTLEREEAQLSISVLRIKSLPLEVGFTNVPMGFPLEELKELMAMSADTVEVAGPTNVMDNYGQLRVGYIDIRTLNVENATYQFEVILPSDSFSNLSGTNAVSVEFDTLDWDDAVLNLSEIQLLNEPVGYEVELVTTVLGGVQFVGDQEIIAELSPDDVVVEVDLADRELSEGQTTYPVKISVPSKGLVWAVGEPSVIIRVAETGD